jgi:hypothetical protein
MGNPLTFLTLRGEEQMAGFIELLIDPALEVAQASPDEQLGQDVAQGLASC